MEIISEQSLAGDVEGEFKVAEKVIRPKTVQELLMSSEKKGTGKPAKKAGSVSALEQAWKEAVSEVYACFVPQLTQKQLGMLKHFREKAPAGKSEKVLDWAVRNWIEFVKAVETKVGLKTTPAEPRLDFLLLHVGIAANMAIVTPKSATVKQEAPVAKKPPHVPQLISQKQAEEEATPSVAELLAILNDKDPS